MTQAPDFYGEVLGWRDWNVSLNGHLISRLSHYVWEPGINTAICGQRLESPRDNYTEMMPHPAPQEKCGCGLYGQHSSIGLDHGPTFRWASSPMADGVAGLFCAWGTIIVHAGGIRAEHAEILGLVSERPTMPISHAAHRYDVPLFTDTDEAMAYATDKGYGLVPKHVRPTYEVPEGEHPWRAYIGTTPRQKSAAVKEAKRIWGHSRRWGTR